MNNNINTKPSAKKLMKSGIWFSIGSVTTIFVSLIKSFAIAKILDEYQWGLLSLLFLILDMIIVLSEFGVKDALIREKEIDDNTLDTAFYIELFRNLICFVILILSAGTFAKIYEIDELKGLIIIISFKFLITGLKNINLFTLYNKYETRKLFLLNDLPLLIINISTIFIAYYTKSLVGIVITIIIGEVILLLLSYTKYPYIPKLNFDMKIFKKLFGFCMQLFILTTLAYILRQIDYLFISKKMGIVALGIYTLAYKVTNTIITRVSYVISNLAYPLFSILDRDGIKRYFIIFNEILIHIFLLFSFGMVFYFNDFVTVFFEGKSIQLYYITCSLLCFSFFRLICSLQGNIYKALGKPHIDNKLSVCEILIIIITIYPLYSFMGIYGVVASITIAIFVRFLLSYRYMIKEINFNYLKDIKLISKLLLTLYGIIIHKIINYLYFDIKYGFLINAMLFVILYMIFLALIEKNLIITFVKTFKKNRQ